MLCGRAALLQGGQQVTAQLHGCRGLPPVETLTQCDASSLFCQASILTTSSTRGLRHAGGNLAH
jgi:hypothetical protein